MLGMQGLNVEQMTEWNKQEANTELKESRKAKGLESAQKGQGFDFRSRPGTWVPVCGRQPVSVPCSLSLPLSPSLLPSLPSTLSGNQWKRGSSNEDEQNEEKELEKMEKTRIMME